MNTFQTKSLDENQAVKRLFQRLFSFQIELERLADNSREDHQELEKLNESITELMAELIDYYYIEKS